MTTAILGKQILIVHKGAGMGEVIEALGKMTQPEQWPLDMMVHHRAIGEQRLSVHIAPVEALIKATQQGSMAHAANVLLEYGMSPGDLAKKLQEGIDRLREAVLHSFNAQGFEVDGFETLPPADRRADSDCQKALAAAWDAYGTWRADFHAAYADPWKSSACADAAKAILEEAGAWHVYGYSINLDERGEFRADVRDPFNQKSVYEIASADDGEIPEIADGYMRSTTDIDGLASMLKARGVIANDAQVMPLNKAERELEAAANRVGGFASLLRMRNIVEPPQAKPKHERMRA